ncbi:unnamed protein product [Fraxinus pennsylvanica]|uniref:Uncharacterized protein n=1 Tax=Fraxinus pennsylvanica TaxID=56036 RepID=A0AAD1ZZT4_9LAMI|nr:unnamed protein product [Fraxinus pennsylvanica]
MHISLCFVFQKTRSHINIEGVKIFSTPRKLTRSLQDPDGMISDFSERQTRRFGSPFSSKFEWTPTSRHEQNDLAQGITVTSKEVKTSLLDGNSFMVNQNQYPQQETCFIHKCLQR